MNILSLSTLTNSFSSVKLSNLKIKYQAKKQKTENQELTAQQRERQSVIDRMQEQAEQDRKNAKIASIEAKFKSSGALSADEIAYLQKESPGYYEELVKQRAEADGYEKALKSCDTKEDVSSLHMVKLSQFMTEANTICNSAVIPKGKKLELMMKLESRVENISSAHTEFVSSEEYARLPSIYDKEEPAPEEEEPVKEEEPEKTEQPTDSGEKTESAESSGEAKPAESGESSADAGKADSAEKPKAQEKAAHTEHTAEKKPAKAQTPEKHTAPKKPVKAETHTDEGEVKRFISYEIERLRGFKSKNVDVKI